MSDAGKHKRLLVAGGATGGHLFPGIAVAQQWAETQGAENVLFVGTNKPMEIRAVSLEGFAHRGLGVEGFLGRGLLKQPVALIKLLWGIVKAAVIVKKFSPDLVLGVGGYASAPALFAARLLGKKIAIQEQNVIPGAANKFLAKVADRVYASYFESVALFGEEKTLVAGNPIRQSLMADFAKTVNQRKDGFTVMILGGSQGAHILNEAIVKALPALAGNTEFKFVHQTGTTDEDQVRAAYKEQGVEADVRPFFQDMADAYSRADLVVCRSGASTVAEVTALGLACVFVPFAQATHNHQEQNAQVLVDADAAQMILERDLSPAILAETIQMFAADTEAICRMQQKARTLGKPGAAKTIVDDALSRLGV